MMPWKQSSSPALWVSRTHGPPCPGHKTAPSLALTQCFLAGLVTLNDMKAKQEALVKEREKQLAKKEQSKELQL